MLAELNKLAHNYEYLINAIGASLPFLISLLMFFVAYQQWLINKRIETFKLRQEKHENFTTPVKNLFLHILETSISKDTSINKQHIISEDISKICDIYEKYFYLFKQSDYELLKSSYDKLKNWILKTKEYTQETLTLREIWESCKLLLSCLGYIFMITGQYNQTSEEGITLYRVIGTIINRIYVFIVPYWLQKKLKKYFYPKFFVASVILALLFALFSPKKKKKQKVDQSKIEKDVEPVLETNV